MATPHLPNRPIDGGQFATAGGEVPAGPQEVPAGPQEVPFFITAAIRKWWILLICLIVSGAAAAGVAFRFASDTYEAQASLIYTGLPMPPGQAVYRPPTVATYTAMFMSPSNLLPVINQEGLPLTLDKIERYLEVKPGGHRSDKIDLTFKWNDEQEAISFLDGLMEFFTLDVAKRRKDTIDSHMRHTEKMMLSVNNNFADVVERRRAYLEDESSTQQKQLVAERELESLSAAVESIKTSLEEANLRQYGVQTEIDALTARRTQLVQKYKQKLLTEMQDRFSEAVEAYGPKSSARSRLEDAGKQFQAIAENIDHENEDEDLSEWTTRLLEIDATISKAGEVFRTEAFEPYLREIDSIESRQRDLQLSVVVNNKQVELLAARLQQKEEAILHKSDELEPASDFALQLEAEYNEAQADRLRMDQQLDGLSQMRNCEVNEFTVATPAYISDRDSNAKKQFVMTLFGLMAVLSAPVFAHEYFSRRVFTSEQAGKKFGLPVLAPGLLSSHLTEGGLANLDLAQADGLRLLALRIQQSISQPGSTVLFSSLSEDQTTFPLLCGLSRCFSERGEHVLVIDAGKSASADNQHLKVLFGSPPYAITHETDGAGDQTPENDPNAMIPGTRSGLSDYLLDENMPPSEIVLPTRLQNVDCMCCGSQTFPPEGFATRRMSDVFDYARKQYEIVLVAGPPASKMADLQILAARADGILFTAPPGKALPNHSQAALQEFLELQAPIIGIVG